MPVPFLCLVGAFLLLVLTKVPVAMAMQKQPDGYDNRHPRDQQINLVGWGRRALAAHQNMFESFAPFAAAVITSHIFEAESSMAAGCAMAYLGARILYTVVYLANWGVIRSLIWSIGYFATLGLFISPWL